MRKMVVNGFVALGTTAPGLPAKRCMNSAERSPSTKEGDPTWLPTQ
jgi:hypothetical protein